MFQTLVLSAVLFCVVLVRSEANEVLYFVNDTARPMEVWVYPRTIQKWRSDCPIRVSPGSSVPVTFSSNVEHFILLRDDLRREWPLQWRNITEMLRDHPDYTEIALSAYTLCRQVMVLVWDLRSQSWVRGPEEAPEVRYKVTWGPRRTRPEAYETIWPPCQVPASGPAWGWYLGPCGYW